MADTDITDTISDDEFYDEFYKWVHGWSPDTLHALKNLGWVPYNMLDARTRSIADELLAGDEKMRQALATTGIALDKLVDDPSDSIRYRVAKTGIALDKLINDPDPIVRDTASSESLWRSPGGVFSRLARAVGLLPMQPTGPDAPVPLSSALPDEGPIPYEALDERLQALSYNSAKSVRTCVAKHGLALDRLSEDPDPSIRSEVARQGVALGQLADDPEASVRAAAFHAGFDPEHFASDPDPSIRAEVAKQGVALDRLLYDKSAAVRLEVAKQGFKPEELQFDSDVAVRSVASKLAFERYEQKLRNEFGAMTDREVVTAFVSMKEDYADLLSQTGSGPDRRWFAMMDIAEESLSGRGLDSIARRMLRGETYEQAFSAELGGHAPCGADLGDVAEMRRGAAQLSSDSPVAQHSEQLEER